MTLEDFGRLADTWGGDIERWPEHTRDGARRLAATRQGAEILQRAARLDALMAARVEVSRQRAERAAHAVAMRVAAEPEARSWWSWDVSGWLVPAVSVACSALIGVSLALALPSSDGQEPMVLSMIMDVGSISADWMLQ